MGREGRPLWHAMREHAVHWVVGGVLLSLTGFVPEEWVAHVVHGLRMPDTVLHLWSADVDVRVVPIAIGVAVVAITLICQRHALLLVPSGGSYATRALLPDVPPDDTATTPKQAAGSLSNEAPETL